MKAKHYNDTHKQAEAYIAANKSDPFCRARVYAHITNGLCDDASDGKTHRVDCRYKAEPYLETRKLPPSPLHPNGQEYTVECYRNLVRP